MSRRTSEASKAIREAWENEQRLVLDGRGTRDWTREQQQSIIDKGKVYDEDGRSFEGHHMKSAEAHPEYQGDAGNIQFLSRNEHLEAHGGSFRNPTNGFYDPSTKLVRDFGDNKYEPCEIIKLSNPVVDEANNPQKAGETSDYAKESNVTAKENDVEESADVVLQNDKARTDWPNATPPKESLPSKKGRRFGAEHSNVLGAVKSFVTKHPRITNALKWTGLTVGALALKAIGDAISNSGSPGHSDSSLSDFGDFLDEEDESVCYSSDSEDECAEDSVERHYPEERSSPREHSVSGYDRQQNGKTVHVNPYKRGGKPDSE